MKATWLLLSATLRQSDEHPLAAALHVDIDVVVRGAVKPDNVKMVLIETQCLAEATANGQLHFWKLSEILIVHLKRFAFSGKTSIRLNNVVDVPLDDIDFSPYFAPNSPFKTDAKYRLYAVSNRTGT